MEADDLSLRVASFSCYLNNPEESSVQRIAGAGGSSEDLPRPDNAPFPVRARTSAPVENPTVSSFVFPSGNAAAARHHLERRVIGKSRKDGEISIFDADKYFNMKLDGKLDLASTAPIRSEKIKYNNKKEIPALESPCTKPPKPSTVSVSSEQTSSSLGSKAALLHNPKPRKGIIGRRRRSFFGRFGCQGQCLDKKAVVFDERVDPHGSKQGDNSHKQNSVSSVSGIVRNCKDKQYEYDNNKQTVSSQEEELEEQRKSLEVFGANKMRKGDVAVNLERKLSVLTWDAIPNTTTTIVSSSSNTICDDMASDASSDLFEIENISDKHGLMLPSTQYAPSEASIAWSVVTAGVADHASVISDYDEKSVGIVGGTFHNKATTASNKTGKFKDVTGKPSPRTSFTGLLGCNSKGAVNISEGAHNVSDRRKIGKSIHNCHSPDHLHA